MEFYCPRKSREKCLWPLQDLLVAMEAREKSIGFGLCGKRIARVSEGKESGIDVSWEET